MAQPSHEHVALVLSRCEDAGVVSSWSRRPLGLYHVYEWDGDKYTFDRKGAVLWGQGVLSGLGYAVARREAGQPLPALPVVPTAAGWYPDPGHSAGVRRFNGTAWTNDVRSAPPAGTRISAMPDDVDRFIDEVDWDDLEAATDDEPEIDDSGAADADAFRVVLAILDAGLPFELDFYDLTDEGDEKDVIAVALANSPGATQAYFVRDGKWWTETLAEGADPRLATFEGLGRDSDKYFVALRIAFAMISDSLVIAYPDPDNALHPLGNEVLQPSQETRDIAALDVEAVHAFISNIANWDQRSPEVRQHGNELAAFLAHAMKRIPQRG